MSKPEQRTEYQQLQAENERLGAKVADISQRLIISEITASNRMDSISRKVTLLTVAVTILTIAVVLS